MNLENLKIVPPEGMEWYQEGNEIKFRPKTEITYNDEKYIVCPAIDDYCTECVFYRNGCKDADKIAGRCTNVIFKKMETKKEFTKANLKSGMVVEYRDGRRRLLISINNNLYLYNRDGLYNYSLSIFKDNLKCLYDENMDIVKVYKILNIGDLSSILDNINDNIILIWEREEIQEFTIQEIADKIGVPINKFKIVGKK